jgi:NAD(P)-dependent dehydrogenase (short-subunit alcohol dehydrogenase family)
LISFTHLTDSSALLYTSSYGGGARGSLVLGDPGIAAYPASKSALVGFCASVFEDVREFNIKVVQLALGLVSTPLGRKSMGGVERKISAEQMVQQEEVGDQVMLAVGSSPTCCPTMLGVISVTPPNRTHVSPAALKRADDRVLRTPKL